MIEHVYVVTAVPNGKGEFRGYGDFLGKRTWILCEKLEDAERFVLENQTDWVECLYRWAVIEKVKIDSSERAEVVQWYQVDPLASMEYSIVPIETPDWSGAGGWWR